MKNEINVFFASDDNYLPYLTVAIASLSDHASDNYTYNLHILTTGFCEESLKSAKKLVKSNIKISVTDISEKIASVKSELSVRLRDYYSESIYYRLFIPSLFPELDRAIYLDSDIVVCDDVAKLYFTELGDNILGAVTDESVISVPVFSEYVKRHIGMASEYNYFNSGVLLMDLEKFREARIEEKFIHLLCKYNFHTVAPDQDYLNFLCGGRVLYLDLGWNKHAIEGRTIPKEELHIMHFNMFNKPWHYSGVQNEELFWQVAKRTEFYAELIRAKEAYTYEDRANDLEGGKKLLLAAEEITRHDKSLAELAKKELKALTEV